MANFNTILVFIIVTFIKENTAQLSENRDDLLNWCLESRNHKSKPGKEDSLHEQCMPWRDHACCTEGVTVDVHELNMYNFTFDHCFGAVNKPMSSECRKHFTRDSCFYECEPNIGLWVVKTYRKIATERFFKVPLCASDCDAWFEACKDDYTCAYNWPRDFKFNKGHNSCKKESKCITYKEMYQSSKNFCENVWDNSWVYTSDDKPCMQMWFDVNTENPNREVAEYYIDQRFGPGALNFGVKTTSVSLLNQCLLFLGLISIFI